MRLATIQQGAETRAAVELDDEFILTEFADVDELLRAQALGTDLTGGARVACSEVERRPVLQRPGKIICVGYNYAAHITEMGHEVPEHPDLFAKFANSLISAEDEIVLPSESRQVDWEVELAVVIGRRTRRCSAADAPDHIAGFTIFNDVSMRDWQFRGTQFLAGKSWDACSPIGPALVTLDELEDPFDLEIKCEVDGAVRQQGRTSDLVFGPRELIAYASTIMTLEPGDVISSGTPGGVGASHGAATSLVAGNLVRSQIDGIGSMENRCVLETGARP
jgi:acylpyruvate hydrolase